MYILCVLIFFVNSIKLDFFVLNKHLKKNYQKKNFVLLILICSLLGLAYSVFNIISWKFDTSKINTQIDLINKNANIREITDTENTQIVNPPADKTDIYWNYIKIPLIDVKFDELKKINTDTKGWIQVRGTNINFPFVQTKDNDFYLTHSFDKSRNQAGWVFLDYRNNVENLGNNTILYAHGRVGGTMFGTLKNIVTSNWYSNPDNHVVRVSTEKENTLWQVFSVYQIKTTNDYLQTSFSNKSDYQSFLNLISQRSILAFDVNLNTEDRILSLSTCLNKNEKVVMHAKLIKKETK